MTVSSSALTTTPVTVFPVTLAIVARPTERRPVGPRGAPDPAPCTGAPTRTPLYPALASALASADGAAVEALTNRAPVDRRDAALALALIHDLHVAPVDGLGDAVILQHHPAVATLKGSLESRLLARLDELDRACAWDLPTDPVSAVRAIASRDQVPELYRWVGESAGRGEMIDYLAVEGGPDGGFDDLVSLCQVGLDGAAKLELGQNYWDEMGGGDASRVHTELYRRFVRAVDLPVVAREDQPVESVERTLLGSLLATNRVLQPEMVGALGLIELQAGPRCRRVLAGLDRLGFGADAREFYEEHAVADPRHGKAWLDKVIATLAVDPGWAAGIVRGARWRWLANDQFFTAMAERFDVTVEDQDR